MKNIIQRLLLFIIGVPLVLVLPICLSHFNFLAFFIAYSVVLIIATNEIHKVLKVKFSLFNWYFFVFVAFLNLVSLYFFTYDKIRAQVFTMSFVLPILSLVISEIIITQKSGFEKSLERILSAVFIFLYPIWLGDFVLLLTQLSNPRLSIATFLIAVFSCDSLAWVFGMLFGNGNRGIIKASPKKSIAGFFGVFVSIIATTFLAYYFVSPFTSFYKTLFIMFSTHVFAVLGDIFASIIKRSIGIKDFGSIVMGRGGILDNMDSILFAAPVFYFLCKWML